MDDGASGQNPDFNRRARLARVRSWYALTAVPRPNATQHARRAENPQGARQSTVGDRRHYASRHYTHTGPVVFACRAATVASSVNAPEQRPSVSAATWHRRSAQPRSTAMMARSRRPLSVVMSGTFRSAWACFSDSQLPARTPMDLALFTRAIPAASSGASRPLSVASTASLRMADIRTMMDEDPRPRSSRVTRHALTVALVKPGRGDR